VPFAVTYIPLSLELSPAQAFVLPWPAGFLKCW
jgi:hypothetical protein